MAKKQAGFRLSNGVLDCIDWLAKHLEDQGFGEKSQADVIELAIGNLYKNGIPGLIDPVNKSLDLRKRLAADADPPAFPDPEPKTAGRRPYKGKE